MHEPTDGTEDFEETRIIDKEVLAQLLEISREKPESGRVDANGRILVGF